MRAHETAGSLEPEIHFAEPTVTYAGSVRGAAEVLSAAGVPAPRLDAEVLLAFAAGCDRGVLFARSRDSVPEVVRGAYRKLLERRCRREPVAYITGRQEFWSLPFAVDTSVLIPRPETELLVEVAQGLLEKRRDALVCDVGTGSGCIAVALAHDLPRTRVVGVDVSSEALRLAHRNIRAHGVRRRVHLVCGDSLSCFRPSVRFDVIVSNPPYVGSREQVAAEVLWEPEGAVRAGRDGLEAIVRLLETAPRYLQDGGALVMEFGCGQETAVRRLARSAGFRNVSVRRDLAGLPRVLIARTDL